MTGPITTESILALLRRHRAGGTPAPELTQAERAWIWDAACTDAQHRGYALVGDRQAAAHEALCELAACGGCGADVDAQEDWDRRRALARGDDLAAHYPRVSADRRKAGEP